MRKADNHRGWDVQRLTATGWQPINTAPFVDRAMADEYRKCCDPADGEFRVYEALHTRRVRPDQRQVLFDELKEIA
jgi:hypothetical protein